MSKNNLNTIFIGDKSQLLGGIAISMSYSCECYFVTFPP